MKSLFNQQHVEEVLSRINRLKADSTARWGKMNVAQMLAHCQVPLQMAIGELQVKGNPVIRFLLGRLAKKQLLRDEAFKRNLPTFREAVIVDPKVFELEKRKLIESLRSFHRKGPEALVNRRHPFFGNLSIEEWDALQAKHLDHHLSQFGV